RWFESTAAHHCVTCNRPSSGKANHVREQVAPVLTGGVFDFPVVGQTPDSWSSQAISPAPSTTHWLAPILPWLAPAVAWFGMPSSSTGSGATQKMAPRI